MVLPVCKRHSRLSEHFFTDLTVVGLLPARIPDENRGFILEDLAARRPYLFRKRERTYRHGNRRLLDGSHGARTGD